jgi:hypothetical protein
MNPAPLAEIKACLIDLTGAINRSDTRGMLASMEQLDALVRGQSAMLDARLAHFLERRSYAKAIDYLGGAQDVPRGRCGSASS